MDFTFKTNWVSRLARPALAVALLGSGAAWAQPVSNPGFETGALPPWVATFAGGGNGADVSTSQGAVLPHTGNYFAWAFDNDGIGRLSQNVTTVAGGTYAVSAWVARTVVDPANVASIRLGAANTPVACTMGAAGVWAQCTGSFTAAAASERLDLLFGTANGTGTIAFDDVTVTQTGGAAAVQPVPTLSEWVLLALAAAAGGLGLRRLRRNG